MSPTEQQSYLTTQLAARVAGRVPPGQEQFVPNLLTQNSMDEIVHLLSNSADLQNRVRRILNSAVQATRESTVSSGTTVNKIDIEIRPTACGRATS